MEHESIIHLEKVSAGYNGLPVFHNLDLTLPEGCFVGLVGPSGSGKSTLLKIMLGLVTPTGGRVFINHKLLQPGRIPPEIGYVPQLEMVDWNFPVTVGHVVMMGRMRNMSLWPWPSRADKLAMEEMLERLGLGGLANRHIRELSGGQQQRVFLARALLSRPKLLLLDEPTSGVDVKTRNDILQLLSDINRQGIALVMTTHDLNSVASLLPYLVCMNQGIIAQGRTAEVFTPEVLNRTYNSDMEVIYQSGRPVVIDRVQVLFPQEWQATGERVNL